MICMYEYLPLILILVIVVAAVFLVMEFTRRGKKKRGNSGRKPRSRDRNTIRRDAERRLSQNPKDPEALQALANLSFQDEEWEKAMKTYSVLIDLCATNADLDEFEMTLKYALAALKVKNYEEAYKSLMIARSMKNDVFEVNHNLGFLEYKRKNYDKSAALLMLALQKQPEHQETQRYYGLSLFRIKRFRDALTALRKVVDLQPDDKEALFAMGECYYELGQNDPAIRIFTHLRPDPQLGPSAALFAGTIHLNGRQFPKAIMDLEIGLRHKQIRQDVALELRYRLAAAYVKQQEVGKALRLLDEIQEVNPGYRDVPALVKRYQELSDNRNLQTFLMAPPSEFVTLCRKVVSSYFPRSKTKIIDISIQKNEFADILAQVETRKWEDLVLFRFIRTTGQVGELLLRDFHSRIKDMKAGRGFCMTAGTYTDGAKAFVEARLLDLIEKDKLMTVLQTADRQGEMIPQE